MSCRVGCGILAAAHEHVLGARRELERIAAPHHHVRVRPGCSDPTRSATPNISAGVSVTARSASSHVIPYATALPASYFMLRTLNASSSPPPRCRSERPERPPRAAAPAFSWRWPSAAKPAGMLFIAPVSTGIFARGELVGHHPRFGAAADDQLEVVLARESQRRLDVGRLVGDDEQRQPSLDDRNHRLEVEPARRESRASRRARTAARCVHEELRVLEQLAQLDDQLAARAGARPIAGRRSAATIATGALIIMSVVVPSTRSSIAAWPETRPPGE